MAAYNASQIRTRRLRRLVIGLALMIAIGLFLADREKKSALAAGRDVSETISGKVLHTLGAPLRGIEAIGSNLSDRRNLRKDNERLRAEVQRLRDIEMQSIAMQSELIRFKKILNVETAQDVSAPRIVARSVTEPRGPFAKSALIAAGANKGLKKGDAVMALDGLYGHIINAGTSTSRVLVMTDINSHIPVKSVDGASWAILSGNNTDRAVLEFLSGNHKFSVGDIVLTSGDEGRLPAGLRIGMVEMSGDDELSVRPSFLDSPVDWVWVYPIAQITPPVNESETTDEGQP